MPRWPKRAEGMEQPKRARRRKPETAKANLEPPLKELRRTGCPPRGGIRRVCGEVPGRSQWRLLQGRTGRPKVGQGRACTMEAKAFSSTHRTKVFAVGTVRISTFNAFLIAYGGKDLVTPDGKLHTDDPKVRAAA